MKNSLNISLDWDGTVTAEPEGFLKFTRSMRELGHKVYIVTMRYPSECVDIIKEWGHEVDGIFPTSRQAKKFWMDFKGINIHVWIDDTARAIHESAIEIWGTSSPEGAVITPDHTEESPAETVVAEKPTYYISLDVEAKGLHGNPLSFGMVFYSPEGVELHKACGQLPMGGRETFPSVDDFLWVHENVDMMHVTHTTEEGLFRSFIDTLELWREIAVKKGSMARIMADCPYPVETNFLKKAVEWYKTQYDKSVDGLYPVIDVASILLAKGKDPIGSFPRLPSELPMHNPVNDARQSARIFFETMGILPVKQD